MRDLLCELTYFLDSPLFWILGLLVSKFCLNYATQIAYCAVFGLTSVITIDIMGIEAFVHAYGVQFLFMGAACVISPPLVGKYDLMLKYTNT